MVARDCLGEAELTDLETRCAALVVPLALHARRRSLQRRAFALASPLPLRQALGQARAGSLLTSLSHFISRLISADCSRSLSRLPRPYGCRLHSSPPISLSPTRHYTAIVLVAQSIWKPPFMSITSPVMKPDSGDARKRTACATSSGLQKRRTGTVVRKQESNHIC